MDKSLTAEEKLLRVIRRKSDATLRPQEGSSQDPGKRNSPGKNDSDVLSWVNVLLVVLSLIAAGYLVFQYLNPPQNVLPAVEPEVQPVVEQAATEADRPFNEYLGALDERNIFEMPWEKSRPQEVVAAPVVDVTLPKLNELIKVVGIMLDKNPQAIIEDIATNQTVFVSVGQTIKEATVEQILEDKVIFNFHGQKVEINK